MIDKPNRKFWQFYLSTAIVAVLLAGALLGANLMELGQLRVPFSTDEPSYVQGPYRGWPFPYELVEGPKSVRVICLNTGPNGEETFVQENDETTPVHLEPARYFEEIPTIDNVASNIIVCIGALLLVTLGLETLIRRREARKP